MRTSSRPSPARRGRPRSRFGYDHRWWGESEATAADPASYWSATRRPLPCLAFVAPLLLSYELGVLWLGGASAEAIRTGADAWMRRGLSALGLTDRWLLPLALVTALLAWQAVDRRSWRFSPGTLAGMAVESVLLAIALIGLSRLVDLGFHHLEHRSAPPLAVRGAGTDPPAAALIGFLGAGVYEEALFRLTLIPLFFGTLRLLQTPTVLASSLAVTASSLLFAVAHHAGTPGEAFTWFAFVFRWLAGISFAWVFVVRGFGIAVGTHCAYDVLVGWFGWHL